MKNPGDSNEITREYFDSILIKTRYIDSELPDMGVDIFGKHFRTPLCSAALSHMNSTHENGMTELAKGMKAAGGINFCGMESYEGELDDIMTAGADTIRMIKPHADNGDVVKRIEHAKKLGVFAMGMDIDHAYNGRGGYDVVEGLPMKPKSAAELKEFVKAAEGIPFVIKGVLSSEDAEKCMEIGASGIVVSHHHGIMPYSVPPAMVLPDIKKKVGSTLTVFADCGVNNGVDAFKLLTLGADAVCLGRLLMEPLGKSGAAGVTEKINEVTAELRSIMARTGYHFVKEIDDSCIMFKK